MNLYAYEYNDNGETWLHIYEGIYNIASTRGNKMYDALRPLGNVNITKRKFYKRAKFPKKILQEDGDNILLVRCDNKPGVTVRLLNTLFANLGYSDQLLNEVVNVVTTQSRNNKLKTYDHNRIDGENEGIVDF